MYNFVTKCFKRVIPGLDLVTCVLCIYMTKLFKRVISFFLGSLCNRNIMLAINGLDFVIYVVCIYNKNF